MPRQAQTACSLVPSAPPPSDRRASREPPHCPLHPAFSDSSWTRKGRHYRGLAALRGLGCLRNSIVFPLSGQTKWSLRLGLPGQRGMRLGIKLQARTSRPIPSSGRVSP